MWKIIKCNFSELNLDYTLTGGQSFRWKKNENSEWRGVLCDAVWTLKQDTAGNILYVVHNISEDNCDEEKSLNPPKKLKKTKQNVMKRDNSTASSELKYKNILVDYFNLHLKLEDYYSKWSKLDNHFKIISKDFKGIRILRQDPTENLFSFICSANNNISRITSMVDKLCFNYGEKICSIGNESFYTFPSVKALSDIGVEEKLRKLGFGYRAKYIYEAAKYINDNKDPMWLESLRTVPYEEAHDELIKLPGVGAKVADCICLMSLDKHAAIPVDTHIWQVTIRDYLPHLKDSKSLSKKVYQEIGNFYRERFGDYAGWANTVLFAADLKKFKERKKIIV